MTRKTASEQCTLAIEDIAEPALGSETRRAAVLVMIASEVSMSITDWAIISWAMPSWAIRDPNISRVSVRSRAMSSERRARPSQRMQCVSRAGPSRTWAYLKPRPTSPSTASGPTTTSSKCRFGWPPAMVRSPVWIGLPSRTPRASMSTRNIVALSVSVAESGVRAMTIANPACSAPLVKRLFPEMVQESPSRVAVVSSPAGSDPAPGWGSVMPKQENVSPAASGAR